MKILHLVLLISGIFLFSCVNTNEEKNQDEKSTEEQIAGLEADLFGDENMRMNKRKALDLVKLYVKFSDNQPSDPRSSDYLFKAADISMNLNRPSQTIALFDQFIKRYPDHEKAPTALFLKGFVLEDQIQDYEGAREVYTQFLERYPESDFADDAKMSLENLGKTPEELIREFESQSQ
ncbi:MAG: tetratricopeptide repeat protein [bacterium]